MASHVPKPDAPNGKHDQSPYKPTPSVQQVLAALDETDAEVEAAKAQQDQTTDRVSPKLRHSNSSKDREKIQRHMTMIQMKRHQSANKQISQPDYNFLLKSVTTRVQLQRRAAERRLIFRPGESPFLNWWDVAGIIVLTYTAIYTPFEVAFLPSLDTVEAWTTARFLIARMIDVFFTLDLLLQFTIAYRRVDTSEDGHSVGVWVEDHRSIALNYLSSWFWFDLLTLIPSVFDIIPTVGEDIGSLGGAAIFRTFRILRFVKILRVARAGRVFQRWAARITLQHSTQKVIWCIVRLFIWAHWFACIFALQATLHGDSQDTWLGAHHYNYCTVEDRVGLKRPPATPPPNPPAAPGMAFPVEPEAFICHDLSSGEWYLAAFTWAIMVITGVGGTDFYPSSTSAGETVVVLCLVICGALLWTQILADFCDVASNGDPAGVRYHQTLDELNLFISSHHIPKAMGLRMREFLQAQRYCQLRLETAKSLHSLSPTLQVEVITHVHKLLFEKIFWLRRVDQSTAVLIAMRMHSSVMAPGEVASLRRMYVIERGLVLYAARVLTSGRHWGIDDIILTDNLLKYELTDRARAMSYVEYRSLSRADVMAVVELIPECKAVLRKLAIYVALRRFMVNAANASQDQSKMKGHERFLNRISAATRSYTQEKEEELMAAERLNSSADEGTTPHREPSSQGRGHGEELHVKLESLFTSMDALSGRQAALTKVVQSVAMAVDHQQGDMQREFALLRKDLFSSAYSSQSSRGRRPSGNRSRNPSRDQSRDPSREGSQASAGDGSQGDEYHGSCEHQSGDESRAGSQGSRPAARRRRTSRKLKRGEEEYGLPDSRDVSGDEYMYHGSCEHQSGDESRAGSQGSRPAERRRRSTQQPKIDKSVSIANTARAAFTGEEEHGLPDSTISLI